MRSNLDVSLLIRSDESLSHILNLLGVHQIALSFSSHGILSPSGICICLDPTGKLWDDSLSTFRSWHGCILVEVRVKVTKKQFCKGNRNIRTPSLLIKISLMID